MVLLSGLACVRGEMKKSWKVKSDSENSLGNGLDTASVAEIEAVSSDPKQPNVAAVKQTIDGTDMEKTITSSTSRSLPKSRLRSTYVAKGAISLFNAIRESAKTAPFVEDHEPEIQIDDFSANETDEEEYDDNQVEQTEALGDESKYAEDYKLIENILEEVKDAAEREELARNEEEEKVKSSKPEDSKQYDFGPLLNMTIDEPNNIVNVKLNDKVLKEIFTGKSL